jgi:hypothetical protein
MRSDRSREICLLIEAQFLVRGRSRLYVREAHRRVLAWLATAAAEAPGVGHLHRAEALLARAILDGVPANSLYEAREALARMDEVAAEPVAP